MSKKVYNLITGIVTGVEAIGVAVVTFINPPAAVAINAAIPIVGTAKQIAAIGIEVSFRYVSFIAKSRALFFSWFPLA